MSPHTDPGALLKLADEIDRACKAPNYEARLGTIEGKMVVAALRQAASQDREGGERSEVQSETPARAEMSNLNDPERALVEKCRSEGFPASAGCNLVDLVRRAGLTLSFRVAQEASDCGAEIKRLRAQVEYWRLAAERREARMERSGVDVAEASTLDAPSVPSAHYQPEEITKAEMDAIEDAAVAGTPLTSTHGNTP